MNTRTGAEDLVDALQRLGVDCVFGLPGTQNVALLEALRKSAIRLVVATSELSAAMMANGYYRASGRPGVLVTIPGPGFTWALSGLAEASLDSAAILHITSAPARSPGQHFQLQALDQPTMVAPVSRSVATIERADRVAAGIADAYRACVAGEPGPVLVQIARGVWEEEIAVPAATGAAPQVASTPADGDADDAVGKAAELAQAGRCVLLLGQGCHAAAESVTLLAERLRAPVVTTTSGRGAVAEDHPLSLGFPLAGNDSGSLNALIESCDIVLAIGCKFSHNGSRGFRLRIPRDKLVHVDASHDVLGANYPARLAIRADASRFVPALLARLDARQTTGFDAGEIAQWRARCETEKLRGRAEPRIHGVPSATPEAFFAALRAAMPRAASLITDSGRHQDLARRYFPVWCPRGLITPTNLQSMGFAIGAAIGAKLANPGQPVVALIGDGGLAMSGLELLTAVREQLDLTVIVFVDGAYAAIRDQQIANYGRTSGTEFAGPDCAALAEAVGAAHVRLASEAQATLRSAITARGVTVVEVAVGDSLPQQLAQAKGYAKSLLGTGVKARLRRLLRRS